MMATPSDKSARVAALLSRVAMGDQAAFAEFYEVTSAHLYGVALRILKDPPAAEEILQEAYVNVWHHAASYEVAKSQPMTWLTSIVRSQRWTDLQREPRIGVVVDAGSDFMELRGVEIRGVGEPIGEVPRTGEPVEALDVPASAARCWHWARSSFRSL